MASAPPNTTPRITFEEFLLSGEGHVEFVDGQVVEMSPVQHEHSNLQAFLLMLLRAYVQELDLGEVHGEPMVMRLPGVGHGRSPDIMFIAKDRLDGFHDTFYEGAADLVVEIVSTESRARDRGAKFYEYEEAGVREYWLIDPQRQEAEFYVRNERGLFHAQPTESGNYSSPTLPGFWIKIDWLTGPSFPKISAILRMWGL